MSLIVWRSNQDSHHGSVSTLNLNSIDTGSYVMIKKIVFFRYNGNFLDWISFKNEIFNVFHPEITMTIFIILLKTIITKKNRKKSVKIEKNF